MFEFPLTIVKNFYFPLDSCLYIIVMKEAILQDSTQLNKNQWEFRQTGILPKEEEEEDGVRGRASAWALLQSIDCFLQRERSRGDTC